MENPLTQLPAATNVPPAPQSPNDLLATQIAEALVAAGLIKDTHSGRLLAKLKTGGVRQEDWKHWIGEATAPQAAPGEINNE